MNAPDLGVITPSNAGLVVVKLEAIRPSKTNPRKHFDEAAMAELAESVKQHGVIQPILVRPSPDEKWIGYELVAGERRYRAAKAAGLAEIPAIVRDLTDLQALELQVVENLKRADLHPLEEAEGYERLLEAHGMTVDAIADKLGKSKAYVYARLKLTALCTDAREAFYTGKLNPSTALLIARIPNAKLQTRATEEITEPDYRGETLSVRTAAEHIQRNYMLRLDQAPFSTADATLVKKAGACTTCQKRTGNQPELFGDIKEADTCTDPTCFQAKRLAHWAKARRDAEATGVRVIAGDEAKEIKPYDYGGPLGKGYVRLSERCPDDDKGRTYEKILGASLPYGVRELLEDPKTKDLIAVAKKRQLTPLLKEKGIATARDKSAEKPGPVKTRDAVGADTKHDTTFQRVLRAIHEQPASAITAEDLADVATEFYFSCGMPDVLALWFDEFRPDPHGRRSIIEWDQLRDRLLQFTPGDLGRFMIETLVCTNEWELELCELLKRRGIDVQKIADEVLAELEAETKAKQEEAPATPAKAKKAARKKS